MDVFRFHNPEAPTKPEHGEIINDLKSKMWVERYRQSGEFRFVANADSNVRETLPIGSFISHVDSTELMIVEDHQINDEKDKETEIIVTGRGFETFLEHRIVGSNKGFPAIGPVIDFVIAANFTWNQVVGLILDHIHVDPLLDDNDALPNVQVYSEVTGNSVAEPRSIKRGDLYDRIIEILEVDNLGLKVLRPGPWSPAGSDIALIVHAGVDRSKKVIFSYDTGEIESSDYLWSNKKLKTSALVTGRWVEIRVDDHFRTKYDRRMMFIDASDIDEAYDEQPTGAVLDAVISKMRQRGLMILAAQREIALTKTEVSKDNATISYRKDYHVGDLITVSGAYPEITTKRRISEYVEIEDETGTKGYPTLTMD